MFTENMLFTKYNKIFVICFICNSALLIMELHSTRITSGTASLLSVAFNYYFIIS
jgi:hypothetical protein